MLPKEINSKSPQLLHVETSFGFLAKSKILFRFWDDFIFIICIL